MVPCKQRKTISLLMATHMLHRILSHFIRVDGSIILSSLWTGTMSAFHQRCSFSMHRGLLREKQLRFHFPALLAIKYVTGFHQWDMGRGICRTKAKSKLRSVFAFSGLSLFSPICQLDANTRGTLGTTCQTWQSLGHPWSHWVTWLSGAHIELESVVFRHWDFRLSLLQYLA